MSKDKLNTKQIGNSGEDKAANYLLENDYEILSRNYRFSNRGEIDIIAKKNGILIFVEVKTAFSTSFGSPDTWVTPSKQKQIVKIAKTYIHKNEFYDMDCRFDVIAITENKLNHIKDAFWGN